MRIQRWPNGIDVNVGTLSFRLSFFRSPRLVNAIVGLDDLQGDAFFIVVFTLFHLSLKTEIVFWNLFTNYWIGRRDKWCFDVRLVR